MSASRPRHNLETPNAAVESPLQDSIHDIPTLFTRTVNLYGKQIQRPLSFYVGLNKAGKAAVKRLIITHGGQVVEYPRGTRSSVISLVDPHSKASEDGRIAYSVDYIQKSIDARQLLDIQDFQITRKGRRRRRTQSQSSKLVTGHNSTPPKGPSVPSSIPIEPEKQDDSSATDNLPCVPLFDEQNPSATSPQQNTTGLSRADSTEDVHPHENIQTQQTNEGEEDKTALPPDETNQPGIDQDATPTSPVSPPKDPNGITSLDRVFGEIDVARIPTPEQDATAPDNNTGPPNTRSKEMPWTKKEDNQITEICLAAKNAYHEKGRDSDMVFTINCWAAMEKADLLLPDRTKEECLARAKELWKGDGKTKEKDSAKADKRRPPRKRSRQQEEVEVNADDEGELRRSPRLRRKISGGAPRITSKQPSGEDGSQLKDANRGETRQYIKVLVERVASRASVSKRAAFRALREEKGHWRRALRSILGR